MSADGRNFLEWASRIPWRRGQTPLAMVPQYEDVVFQLYFENNDYSEFWRQPGLAMDEYFDSFPDMPILWMVGWYDWYPKTIIDGFQKMVKMNRKHQHLLVGPWTHGNCKPTCGDVHFGPEGGLHFHQDFLQLYLEWFNRWLKEDDAVDVGSAVRMFRMGGGDGGRDRDGLLKHGGKWFSVGGWPPEGSRETPYYIHKDGTLSAEAPSAGKRIHDVYLRPARYRVQQRPLYHPLRSDEGGVVQGDGAPATRSISRPFPVMVFRACPLPRGRMFWSSRPRRWMRTSPLRGTSRGFCGFPRTRPIRISFLKLLDVYSSSLDYPNGYALPVSEGILRVRYRDSFERPCPMEPGTVYRIEIDMQPSANLFRAGHRIRLDICSSNFPNYDINRNTGDPDDRSWRIAQNTVYHEAGRASYVQLPVWTA